MNRKTRLILLLAAGSVFLTAGCSGPENPPPNVIFIILDAARADHFSTYGYGKNTTPRMDKIGEEGAVFLKHFSNATYTPPSVAKFLSSRYYSLLVSRDASPNYNARRESPDTLFKQYDEQQILLPEVFSQNGYRTLMIHNNGWFDRNTHIFEKFDQDIFLPSVVRKGQAPWEDKIVSELITWLRDNGDERFFVYCHIMSPHSPYPEKESDEIFLAGISPSEREAVRATARKSETGQLPGKRWDEREVEILNGLYDSNLHHADLWMGRLLEALEEMGLADNTLLVISADHGEMLGEHHSYGHHKTEWDPQIHIPLIMRYPPRLPAGTRVSGLTESVDVMPTILDICGLEPPEGKKMDGVSLLRSIGNPDEGKTAVFTESAVRTRDYKYIMSSGGMLFDLGDDPGENINLADREPELAGEMRELHGQSLSPYRERYENSVRNRPPGYSFYISIDDFGITPASAYESASAWNEESAGLPWVLVRSKANFGLYRVPENGADGPLTAASEFLDGTYAMSLLLESPREIDGALGDLGFRYRYGDQETLREPAGVELLRRSGESYLYYLDLGRAEVRDGRFTLDFEFSPPDRRPYIIRIIKFVPEDLRGEEAPEAADDEIEIRVKNLKALGYIQ